MKMKSIVCAALLIAGTLTSRQVVAQEQQTPSENSLSPKFGIKGGLNFTNLRVDNDDEGNDENMKTSFHAGFFAKLPVTRGFSIQPELLYSSKGSKLAYDNIIQGEGEYRFNLNYIELPVLAVVNLGKNFNIHAGPYVSYLANVNIKNLDDDGNMEDIADLDEDDFNRFDYGVAGGVGFDISNFTLGARYSYGLKDIGKDDNIAGQFLTNSRNTAIQVYIGLGF